MFDLKTLQNTYQFIREQYEKGRSTYSIAKELNTYANKIRDILIKIGVKLRDKGEAQRKHLELGGLHPTKGKPRDRDTKEKISKKVKLNWEERESNA